jgi:hypothetical protein
MGVSPPPPGTTLYVDLLRVCLLTANFTVMTLHRTVCLQTVEVEVIFLLTVSRPVRLGVRHPSRTRYQFFFFLEIFFRLLRVCYFVAPSLTRRRVCNLLLLLVLASAVPIGSEYLGTQDHILLSQFLRLLQPGGSLIYIPQ